MSGKEIKRIVCLSLSFILLAATFVLFPWNDAPAGMGSGKNAELTTMEDLSILLQDFSSELTSFDESRYTGSANSLSLLGEEQEGQDRETRKKVHTSVTVEEISSANLDMEITNSVSVSPDSPYKDMISSSSTSRQMGLNFERALKVYITPDAVLYDSDVVLSASTTVNSQTSRMNISARILIYVGKTGVMIRFERFEMIEDRKGGGNFDAILGKWIDFSSLAAEGMRIDSLMKELNGNNFDVLAHFGNTIENQLDDGFLQTGSNYRMKEELFGDFCTTLLKKQGVENDFFEAPYEGGFSVDFYDRSAPRITLTLKNEAKNYSEDTNPYKGVEMRNRANVFYVECDELNFKYIDNTVINTPRGAISPEEAESLMR